MTLRKKELKSLIIKAEAFLETIIKLGKKEHDCSFSIVMLTQKGKITALKEIYEKYYCIKRKDTLKKRRIKSIEMLDYRIKRLKKRSKRYLAIPMKSKEYITTESKAFQLEKEINILIKEII